MPSPANTNATVTGTLKIILPKTFEVTFSVDDTTYKYTGTGDETSKVDLVKLLTFNNVNVMYDTTKKLAGESAFTVYIGDTWDLYMSMPESNVTLVKPGSENSLAGVRPLVEAKGTGKWESKGWRTAFGTLNTISLARKTFEATFIIDDISYKYFGTMKEDVKILFDDIKVEMEYITTKDLVGKPTFKAEVMDTLNINIFLDGSAGIHGTFTEFPGVSSGEFEGIGCWLVGPAPGKLNTISPRMLEATFTINDTVYKYTGVTDVDVKTRFNNVEVEMEYSTIKQLFGNPKFEAQDPSGMPRLSLPMDEFKGGGYWSTPEVGTIPGKLNTANTILERAHTTGKLNTISPRKFEATFTINNVVYRYTGVTDMGMKTRFKNIEVEMDYSTKQLIGKPDFDAKVGDTYDFNILLSDSTWMHGKLRDPSGMPRPLLPMDEFKGRGLWSTPRVNAAPGKLNTISPTRFEATFTINDTIYMYAGDAYADAKRSFKDVAVQLEYTDISQLAGKALKFRAEVTDTSRVNIFPSPTINGVVIHGRIDPWDAPTGTFEGIGNWWKLVQMDQEQSDTDRPQMTSGQSNKERKTWIPFVPSVAPAVSHAISPPIVVS
ncbi:hypothetical protein BD779DRAFT_1547476 [Infundibulicybe gibba]|nr:hypothetical protein BD779DRAFT_1547476 [Infundibulicybe gibba]